MVSPLLRVSGKLFILLAYLWCFSVSILTPEVYSLSIPFFMYLLACILLCSLSSYMHACYSAIALLVCITIGISHWTWCLMYFWSSQNYTLPPEMSNHQNCMHVLVLSCSICSCCPVIHRRREMLKKHSSFMKFLATFPPKRHQRKSLFDGRRNTRQHKKHNSHKIIKSTCISKYNEWKKIKKWWKRMCDWKKNWIRKHMKTLKSISFISVHQQAWWQ